MIKNCFVMNYIEGVLVELSYWYLVVVGEICIIVCIFFLNMDDKKMMNEYFIWSI